VGLSRGEEQEERKMSFGAITYISLIVARAADYRHTEEAEGKEEKENAIQLMIGY
jgi:hypothetical protein